MKKGTEIDDYAASYRKQLVSLGSFVYHCPMDDLVIALSKGWNLKPAVKLFAEAGYDFGEALEDSRKLIFNAKGREDATAMVVRAQDVPTYVESGAADIGVVGADVLAEQQKDLYEPLNLGFGFCRMVVAEPTELSERDNPDQWTHIKIATKYPQITETFFANKGVQIELIKLYGAIELAPLVGLSERIVDLVSTGETLKQNGLVEIEEIMTITAILVVNRASLRTKHETVSGLIKNMEKALPNLEK